MTRIGAQVLVRFGSHCIAMCLSEPDCDCKLNIEIVTYICALSNRLLVHTEVCNRRFEVTESPQFTNILFVHWIFIAHEPVFVLFLYSFLFLSSSIELSTWEFENNNNINPLLRAWLYIIEWKFWSMQRCTLWSHCVLTRLHGCTVWEI